MGGFKQIKAERGQNEVVPLGETTLVYEPSVFPAQCVATRATSDPIGFIDTNSIYNFSSRNGRIYLSATWLLRQAEALGAASAEKHYKLLKEIEALMFENGELHEENLKLKDIIDRIEALEEVDLFKRKIRTGRPRKLVEEIS